MYYGLQENGSLLSNMDTMWMYVATTSQILTLDVILQSVF